MRGTLALSVILLEQDLCRSWNFVLSCLKGQTYKMASIFLICIIHFSLFFFSFLLVFAQLEICKKWKICVINEVMRNPELGEFLPTAERIKTINLSLGKMFVSLWKVLKSVLEFCLEAFYPQLIQEFSLPCYRISAYIRPKYLWRVCKDDFILQISWIWMASTFWLTLSIVKNLNLW